MRFINYLNITNWKIMFIEYYVKDVEMFQNDC